MEVVILAVLILVFLETTFILVEHSFKNFARRSRRKVFIDTSALMDGRILNVAKTHFLGHELVISRSVLRELQLLADGKDNDRRNRARFGLDVASELQNVDDLKVSIYQDALGKGDYVDDRLIELAKKTDGYICTTDYNLNKVATTEGVTVLNINELALVMKNQYLPGERVRVKVTGTGNNQSQGVGHLQDGTMVIVENAATRVNTEIDVDILRYIQTSAGRMVFAKVSAHQSNKKPKRKKK
ncbi:TRAM domain-containing protein [Candidatus Saccharibacteria bacterium]|nr:TRAM domain-containing protein [Candidatus Saccharibacteria bacterium]MBQ9017124.1 TRAM domain-containing protein [Candidatus Saccharibacteria bacterium]